MFKFIDHDRRREEIAEAIWRVIHAQGINEVSVRTVTAETEIPTGSLRYVFPSKADLLVHATELVRRYAQGRVEEHLYEPDPCVLILTAVKELLPLDAERRVEIGVSVALMTEALGDERVRKVLDATHATVRDACHRMTVHLHRAGLTVPGLDVERATTLPYGLVDGPTIHVLTNPGPASERWALSMIEATTNGL